MAAHAFSRGDLVNELRNKIEKAHAMTRSALSMARVSIVGESELFFCCKVGDGAAVADQLASHKVLVRSFDHSPSLIRIGLVPDELSAVRLRETLRLVNQQTS